jgi:hypothetical protein
MLIRKFSEYHMNIFPFMSLPKRKMNHMLILILSAKNPFIHYNEVFEMSDKDFSKFMKNEYGNSYPTKGTVYKKFNSLKESELIYLVSKYNWALNRYFDKYLAKSGLSQLGLCTLGFTEYLNYKNYPCMNVEMRISDPDKLISDLKAIYPEFIYKIEDGMTLKIIYPRKI